MLNRAPFAGLIALFLVATHPARAQPQLSTPAAIDTIAIVLLDYSKRIFASTPQILMAVTGSKVYGGCVDNTGDSIVWGSYYCPATKTVVLDPAQLDSMRGRLGDGAVAYALAHEFAHWIQDILKIKLKRPYHELQADCISGVLLGQNANRIGLTKEDLSEVLKGAYSVGGGIEHGESSQRLSAALFGFISQKLSACGSQDFFQAVANPRVYFEKVHAFIDKYLPRDTSSISIYPGSSSNSRAVAGVPATQEEVNTYTTMGAVASCDLAVRQKVPLTKSLPATSSMVAYILLNRHGGQIVGVGNQKLSDEQLFQGSFLQIVGGVRRGCYDRLDASDKKEVDTILAQLEKAAQNQKK